MGISYARNDVTYRSLFSKQVMCPKGRCRYILGSEARQVLPGRFYQGGSPMEVLPGRLYRGVLWKTMLVSLGSLSLRQIDPEKYSHLFGPCYKKYDALELGG
ncbi:hypothetical protein BgiBS90_023181 [Biomphalaria glabrata]|nr:hypothetical protein BgiBS90_023181 [Biomphalaria glabrata]